MNTGQAAGAPQLLAELTGSDMVPHILTQVPDQLAELTTPDIGASGNALLLIQLRRLKSLGDKLQKGGEVYAKAVLLAHTAEAPLQKLTEV